MEYYFVRMQRNVRECEDGLRTLQIVTERLLPNIQLLLKAANDPFPKSEAEEIGLRLTSSYAIQRNALKRVLYDLQKTLCAIPEIENASGKHGRAEVATAVEAYIESRTGVPLNIYSSLSAEAMAALEVLNTEIEHYIDEKTLFFE